ncbi:hypothetical protein C8Q80DRAFT_1103352 [Daedaleopsis nitida]|nr:hypothetical protein C8Q80DRAFT_1103352 [Daedaleopsis nitida]
MAAAPSEPAAATQPLAGSTPVKEIPVFEFTKRKRWADLLITELNDTIMFVLSKTCQVWYCGGAVTELLGWRDDELVDGDLIDFMNGDDRENFRKAFTESVQSKTEMLAYARMQWKNEFYMSTTDFSSAPKEVLFEIKGRPHYLPDTGEFKCYFAMAQPYPSRNQAMLNTFLELKMENERLQQRVAQLRAQAQALDCGNDNYYTTSDGFGAAEGGRTGYDMGGGGGLPDAEDDGPRKKVKRLAAEQHVCVDCGRTDSPEWRKGPMGPKTLCNACGLRWAKKARKTGDDSEEAAAQGGTTVF